jgi:hypothetical protein
MGAFNYVVFEAVCPCCKRSSSIEAQCHVASSYGGDVSGRFHGRYYVLNSQMAWWKPDQGGYDEWKDEPGLIVEDNQQVVEGCYARCSLCQAQLFAAIRFRDCRPIEMVEIGPGTAWPEWLPR